MLDTKRANVLVVDDSLAAAKRLQLSLEEAGFFVEVVRNGREAWEMAQRRLFDVILTDEQMPVMSGRELCQCLRDDSRYAHTPIIFLTGKRFGVDADDLDEDLRVSATFSKPFHPRSLVHAVETHLSAPRQRKEMNRFMSLQTDGTLRRTVPSTDPLPHGSAVPTKTRAN